MKKAFIRRIAATVAATTGLLTASWAFAEDTIKIGALLIDTGPLAGLKETQTKAINLAIEQINAAGGAAGKKLEPVFITYAGTPDAAVDGATARGSEGRRAFPDGHGHVSRLAGALREARVAECLDGRGLCAG